MLGPSHALGMHFLKDPTAVFVLHSGTHAGNQAHNGRKRFRSIGNHVDLR